MCDYILDRDRDDQREQRSAKKPFFRRSCFVCIHNGDSIADHTGFVKKKPVKKYFICCLFRAGYDTIDAADQSALGNSVRMKKSGGFQDL